MFFRTHGDWENKCFPRNIYHPLGERLYPVIGLTLNSYLFHIDILQKQNNECEIWSRFLTLDIRQALTFTSNDKIEDFEISLQTRRCDNDNQEFGISTILEAFSAKDAEDQTVYIYKCKNNRTVIDSFLGETEEKQLSDINRIYPQNK